MNLQYRQEQTGLFVCTQRVSIPNTVEASDLFIKVEVEQETTYSAAQQPGGFAVLQRVNVHFQLYVFITFRVVLGLEPKMDL